MNRAALITGASRGIGRGISLELAKLGYDLILNFASNSAAATQTALECVAAAKTAGHTIRALPCQADVSIATDRARLIQFTRDCLGRLDLLVNNAGVAPTVRADLLETSEESFDRLININLKGPYFLSQLAAQWMIEQQSSAKNSCAPKIVFITSVSAFTASINRGEYCIAKAGLSMTTKLFAARLAPHGITVFEIQPGIIETDMTGPVKAKYDALIADGLSPIRRWGTPEDVGRAVSAIAQDLLPFSTGEAIHVDGGFHFRTL